MSPAGRWSLEVRVTPAASQAVRSYPPSCDASKMRVAATGRPRSRTRIAKRPPVPTPSGLSISNSDERQKVRRSD